MQRAKRVPPVIAVLVIAALAIASAIMGQAVVQALGLQDDGVAYGAQKPPAKNPVGAKRALAAMPLAFVAQPRVRRTRAVRFYAQGNRYAFFATPDELMLSLARRAGERGAGPRAPLPRPQPRVGAATGAATRSPGEVNYLRSTDPSQVADEAVALPRGRLPRALAAASTCTSDQAAGA